MAEGGDASLMGMFDTRWELIDPNPDVYALFMQFDDKFFEKKLTGVQIYWSKRMTNCAGICYFYPRNRECVIRLSEPLLKLRPRKDMIETLLHEMIHAYLFVTNNNSDRSEHGPQFCYLMQCINAETGLAITIYHTFNEEVASYKVHVWKCDGPCRHDAPYFGTVRRAMNRPPGRNDKWWAGHQNRCSGTFIKIAGPKTRAELKEEKKVLKELNQGTKRLVTGDPGPSHRTSGEIGKSLLYQNFIGSTTDMERLRNWEEDDVAALTGYPMKPGPSATVTSGALKAEEKMEESEEDYWSNFEKVRAIPKWARWEKPIYEQAAGAESVNVLDLGKREQEMVAKGLDNGACLSGPSQSSFGLPVPKLVDPAIFKPTAYEVKMAECPVCDQPVPFNAINEHLDGHYKPDDMVVSDKLSTMKCLFCDSKFPDGLIGEHQKSCLDKTMKNTSATYFGGFPGLENYKFVPTENEGHRLAGVASKNFVGAVVDSPKDIIPRTTGSRTENGFSFSEVDEIKVDTVVYCPKCAVKMKESTINLHLDDCLLC